MERDKSFIKNRKIVIGALTVASIFGGLKVAESKAKTPDQTYNNPSMYLPSEENVTMSQTPIPSLSYNILVIPSESPTPKISKEEQKQNEIKLGLSEVLLQMSQYSHIFSPKYVQDVKIYYPIYKEVADKYNLDWYLLWIVHENETGASAGTRGFAPNSYYKGAMQIDPNTYPESYVNEAAEGLGDLAKLPQRHADDWKEIAAGANILSSNISQYMNLGKNQAVLNSLLLYSAHFEAEKRFFIYKEYVNIFSENIKLPLKTPNGY